MEIQTALTKLTPNPWLWCVVLFAFYYGNKNELNLALFFSIVRNRANNSPVNECNLFNHGMMFATQLTVK